MTVTLGKNQLSAVSVWIRKMKPDNSFAKHQGSSRQVWEGGVESVFFVATGFLHATLLIPSGGLCLCGYVPRCISNDKKDSC